VGASGADSEAVEAAPATLLGRDQELARLYGLIDMIGRRGGALVVRGDAGIGKSVLLEAAADRVRERQVTVVTAMAVPR
jgi:predicted ATPase